MNSIKLLKISNYGQIVIFNRRFVSISSVGSFFLYIHRRVFFCRFQYLFSKVQMICFKQFHQYFIKPIAKMYMSQNLYLQLQWVLNYRDDGVQNSQKIVVCIVNFRFTIDHLLTSIIAIFPENIWIIEIFFKNPSNRGNSYSIVTLK